VAHLSQKLGQFEYFDAQLGHPAWKGKHVLDFGGNVGNFLKGGKPEVEEDKYWCLDVSEEAITHGQRNFPEAHWIWYDRYNLSFHPRGFRDREIPKLEQRFDYILAYSVFTHTDVAEMQNLVSALLELKSTTGTLAFTFIDPHCPCPHGEYRRTNFEWRLERNNVVKGGTEATRLVKKVEGSRWFRLAGDADVYLEDEPMGEPERYEGKKYHVFHLAEFIQEQFPTADILRPANGEMQHCCVLRNGIGR
jgi:hypothetical protein